MISILDFFWREGDTVKSWWERVSENAAFIDWLYRRHNYRVGDGSIRWQPWYLIEQYFEWKEKTDAYSVV